MSGGIMKLISDNHQDKIYEPRSFEYINVVSQNKPGISNRLIIPFHADVINLHESFINFDLIKNNNHKVPIYSHLDKLIVEISGVDIMKLSGLSVYLYDIINRPYLIDINNDNKSIVLPFMFDISAVSMSFSEMNILIDVKELVKYGVNYYDLKKTLEFIKLPDDIIYHINKFNVIESKTKFNSIDIKYNYLDSKNRKHLARTYVGSIITRHMEEIHNPKTNDIIVHNIFENEHTNVTIYIALFNNVTFEFHDHFIKDFYCCENNIEQDFNLIHKFNKDKNMHIMN